MYTRDTIPEGTYEGYAVACGPGKTDSGYQQFLIECDLIVPLGNGETCTVRMTKFGGIENDEGLQYAAQDAVNIGCDIEKPIEEWKPNPKIKVQCKVTRDEYGTKLKSIFPDKPLEAGFMVKKMAFSEEEKATALTGINSRLAAMRQKLKDGKPITSEGGSKEAGGDASTAAANTQQAESRSKRNARTPL